MYIISTTVIVSGTLLFAMIVFRYWEIKVGRVRVEDGVREIGFWHYAYRIQKHLTHKSAHHGTRVGKFVWRYILFFLKKLASHKYIVRLTDMVRGKNITVRAKENSSEYFKGITEHKNKIREEAYQEDVNIKKETSF